MKQAPAPKVPGNTDAERMDNAVRSLFAAPRGAFNKQEARLKVRRERKKRAKKA